MSFTTTNNFTGAIRRATITLEAEGFETTTYYLEQKEPLYKNLLVSIDGENYNNELDGITYGMKGRTIELVFDSNVELDAQLLDRATSGTPAWGTLSAAGNTFSITLPANNSGESVHEGLLSVKAKDAGLSDQPAVEWTFAQLYEMLQVNWPKNNIFNNELVLGPAKRDGESFGTYQSADDEVKVEVTGGTWVSIDLEDGVMKLNVASNDGGENPRTATIKIINPNGTLFEEIVIKQYNAEEQITKSNWSVETLEGTTSHSGNGPEKLIDGENAYWHSDWSSGNQSKFPYEFVFDFGAKQMINTFAILQRQDYHNGCIGQIQIYVSNDKATWTDCGKFTLAKSKEECEAHKTPYNCTLPETYEVQYIKLVLLSNLFSNTNASVAEVYTYLK